MYVNYTSTYCIELLIRGVKTYSKLTDRERLFREGSGGLWEALVLRLLRLCLLCITYNVSNCYNNQTVCYFVNLTL